MFNFGLHLKIWSKTFLRDSIMKSPFFSSSKGNKHGRWEVGKLTFTTILTHFHQFYCTGTFKNICLSWGANKNAGGSRANLSLSKDGNILKKQQRQRWEPVAARGDLLAECNGEAAQFVRGGRLPSHFHPPAIFGGGLFSTWRTFSISFLALPVLFIILYLSQFSLHCFKKANWKRAKFVLLHLTFTSTRVGGGGRPGQLWQRIRAGGDFYYLPSHGPRQDNYTGQDKYRKRSSGTSIRLLI